MPQAPKKSQATDRIAVKINGKVAFTKEPPKYFDTPRHEMASKMKKNGVPSAVIKSAVSARSGYGVPTKGKTLDAWVKLSPETRKSLRAKQNQKQAASRTKTSGRKSPGPKTSQAKPPKTSPPQSKSPKQTASQAKPQQRSPRRK